LGEVGELLEDDEGGAEGGREGRREGGREGRAVKEWFDLQGKV